MRSMEDMKQPLTLCNPPGSIGIKENGGRTMKKMETDIIVVAAGLSGLAAAISAAENGAGVLV